MAISFLNILTVKSYAADKKVEILYFYSPTCSSCAKVSEYLESVEEKYNNIEIRRYNIYDSDNKTYLMSYCKAYSVAGDEAGLVPIIFVRDRFLIDEDKIINQLEKIILDTGAGETNILDFRQSDYKINDALNNPLSFIEVSAAALVNGLNPCSFSMIMFLIILIGNKSKSILRIGISFCIGKMLAFILIGSICYQFMKLLSNVYIINIVNVLFVIIFLLLAGLNIYDFIMIKLNKFGKIKVQLPTKFRKVNHTIIRKFIGNFIDSKFVLPFSALLGMIIASTEFLCSGQLYLSTIVTIIQADSSQITKTMILLIEYSIVYTIPLLLVVIVMAKGMREIELSTLVTNNLYRIKLVYAVMFLLMAIIMIINII
jgi:cytochrome c biogenesis protein CcdA